MLKTVQCKSLSELIQKSAPAEILNGKSLNLPAPLSESSALKKLKELAKKNQLFKNYIGQGYYETEMPALIQRNILENPVWLTSYTPYQSEISQGRLQALLNFQTMITELTEMEVANGSLLDEGTATAEAVNVAFNNRDNRKEESARQVFMDGNIFPQTKEVVKTRAKSAGLSVLEGDMKEFDPSKPNQNIFCAVVQYPDSTGALYDWTDFCSKAKAKGIVTVFIADPLSLCLFKTPGAMGADIVVGSVQRFGLPLFYGGPHAGYIATREKYVRSLPGRIVGVSKDRHGKSALRLAIQTREQHIRKERATSNICTAQALLAVLAGMFAVYHGPEGLRKKALHVHWLTRCLNQALREMGFKLRHSTNFFDTVQVLLKQNQGESIYNKFLSKKINLYRSCLKMHVSNFPDRREKPHKRHLFQKADPAPCQFGLSKFILPASKSADTKTGPSVSEDQALLSFSLNETNSLKDIEEILSVFVDEASTDTNQAGSGQAESSGQVPPFEKGAGFASRLATSAGRLANSVDQLATSPELTRQSPCLKHPVFRQYHSETKMLRYIHRLQTGDLSLTHSMIPLGSCTMKLNGTAELLPLSWPEFSHIHPFAPPSQAKGYKELIKDLEKYLCEITGFKAVSFQPNAGSQGEYAGLLMIQKYHEKQKDLQRKICLIPSSAHGTNFASAVMAGLKPVSIACDQQGNISQADLDQKLKEHKKNLSCFMLTFPSTFGVFEEDIPQICKKVHSAGGLVYLDGANMNSLIGLSQPGQWGADLCHLNLHKTFCIPHGGGGPGVGPVAVSEKLKGFLPENPFKSSSQSNGLVSPITAVSSAPFGSAGILPIPYMYIRLMGAKALKKATEVAILNANYVAEKLKDHYKILYTGHKVAGKDGTAEHTNLVSTKGQGGRVAHECIVDFRKFKNTAEITVEDVAKRLIDYGFHAPTMNWPVPGTLMTEPTESEDKAELDRFCSALVEIRKEIREIEERKFDIKNNVLKNAPHVMEDMVGEWLFPYSREKAFFPLPWVREHKFWPQVSRVENAYGDINLFCTCPTP